MAELRSWMLAKLLWNPGLDEKALRREFLQGYYGPAAGPIGEYLAVLEKAVLAAGDPLGCYSPTEAKFLNPQTLNEAWALLKKAEKKTAGTFEYARRVRIAQLPTVYVLLSRWDGLREEASKKGLAWPWPEKREDLLRWFLETSRAENVTMISEGRSLEDWAAKGGLRN
jgi:hypothetical protein